MSKNIFKNIFLLVHPFALDLQKFQLSENIWWWIEPCGEAPFIILSVNEVMFIPSSEHHQQQCVLC